MKPRTPEQWWTPAMGHYLNLSPADMAALTLEQLNDCHKAIETLGGEE